MMMPSLLKTTVTLALFLCVAGCRKDYDEGCMGQRVYDKDGGYFGLSRLDTLHRDWLPDHMDTIVTFRNIVSNMIASYRVNGKHRDSFTLTLRTREDKINCETFRYEDYCISEYEAFNYQTLTPGILDIFGRRGKSLPQYNSVVNPDSNQIKAAPDFFAVSVGPSVFTIDCDNFHSDAHQLFHPKLKLSNVTYDSIFECLIDLPKNYLIPKGLYYSKTKGIVGYYFPDSLEIWLRN